MRGIAAALLLARGRAAGVLAFAPTMAEARASFVAALLCLPIFLLLRGLSGTGAAGGPDAARALAADVIAYVCSWAGFALASLPLAEAMGRRALWPRLIAAWNWVNLVQYVVLAAFTLPMLLGLSGLVSDALGLAAVGYALWLQWFTARAALGVNGLRAAGFVLLDLGLALFLSGLVIRLSGG
ncbi:hypothetical protein [Roseomonas sp. CECT 9278]|uniref:hypothetical protein n=1 Tax=Roseomonas sp. CECT 9278 TaxID=2845823 RepID=UPI001E5BC8AB|nr:hypothetical protein [Roseomonas sp. CECT 9278]